jgi:opacity protein-like surface antigen
MSKQVQISLIITITSALCLSGIASAEEQKSAAFTGPAFGIMASTASTSLSVDGYSADLGAKSQTSTGITASWGFDMGPDWVLTAELAYNPNAIDLAAATTTTNKLFSLTIDTRNVKARNDISVALAPGYRIDDKQLIFAKFSYHNIDVEGSSETTTTSTFNSYRSVVSDSFRQTIEAPGIGLGYAYAINSRLQLQGEYEYISYSRSGLNKSSQDVLRIGLSYRF